MRRWQNIRSWLMIFSALVLIPALAVADAAGNILPIPAPTHPAAPARLPQRLDPVAADRCTELEAVSPLHWYAIDDQGEADVDEIVDGYPSGTIALAYGFRYRCVPARTIVTELFYALDYSEDPAYSEDHFLAADPKQGGYYWTLTLKDNEPFPDGAYRVEFYLDETLIVSGETTVGDGDSSVADSGDKIIVAHPGRISADKTAEAEETEAPTPRPTRRPTESATDAPEPEPTATATRERKEEPPAPRPTPTPDNKVQIDGMILDGATGRPIAGAVFVVLQPGISSAQWANYGYPPSDILSSNKADRDGKFRHPGLEMGVEYSVIAWALSYQGWWDDGFRLTESDPDPYPLTIELYR